MKRIENERLLYKLLNSLEKDFKHLTVIKKFEMHIASISLEKANRL